MSHKTNKQEVADFLLELGLSAINTEAIVSGLKPEQIAKVNDQSNKATEQER